MTVIRPNSISGINSITANGGDINLFRADGTKADIPIVNNITAGVVTATTFKGAIDATTGTFSGNLGVGGVLTYEDVTNIDSVGIITARGGIRIAAGTTVGPVSGIVTYYGDGSGLTNTSAISAIASDGANRVLTSDGDGTATAHSFVTIESNRLSVNRGSGSGAFPLIVRRTDASGIIAEFANSSGYGLLIGQNSATGEAYLRTGTGQPMVFTTNAGSGIANERLRISSDGYVTKPNQPSFTARSTGTWSHGSSTGYLDIDINMVEEFDVGGNYNGQIFTAPVTGKYFFSYTFQYQCTSGYLVVSLRKGVGGSYSGYGNMHMYPPQQSTKYHGPGIIGIMHLAAGNTVKPVAEVNYAGNQIQNANFSGYLLG